MLRVRNPQDLGAGLLFIAIGLGGLYLGSGLTFGTARAMGPGYFPTVIIGLFLLIGLAVGLGALSVEGPAVERFHLRPLGFTLLSIASFSLLIDRLGLGTAAVAMIVLAALAQTGVRWIETLVFAVLMAAFVVAVFPYALGAQIPIWGR